MSPGLHLEALKGGRAGQRFVWRDGKAADVEIVDYP
jgi:hypothetical protein